MMKTELKYWRYVAEDANGIVSSGILDALSYSEAISQLKTSGLSPINLSEQGTHTVSANSLMRHTASLSQDQLRQFCEQMSDLLNTDVSTSRALVIISEQSRSASLKAFSDRLLTEIRKGIPLSGALTKDPVALPQIVTALVSAGEALGNMGEQFSRLEASFSAQNELRKELTNQLIYPIILFVLMILTIIFLSFFVLPQFDSIFASANSSPPPETLFVLSSGAFIRSHWLLIITFFVISFFILKIAVKTNKAQVEDLLLRTPFLGAFLRKKETALFCRSLGELLCGGMALAHAMPIAAASVSNWRVAEGIRKIEEEVRNGASLTHAISKTPCLTQGVTTFVKLGEETGKLGAMITKAAGYYEQQTASTLRKVAAISGPLMTALMGLMTAGVIGAVMMGVLSLNEAVY